MKLPNTPQNTKRNPTLYSFAPIKGHDKRSKQAAVISEVPILYLSHLLNHDSPGKMASRPRPSFLHDEYEILQIC
uniref:Uncharacterized protein n=1 Tax=Salix viminalis TaxID=40686 RepID=A0A6N2KQG2_SALVM